MVEVLNLVVFGFFELQPLFIEVIRLMSLQLFSRFDFLGGNRFGLRAFAFIGIAFVFLLLSFFMLLHFPFLV